MTETDWLCSPHVNLMLDFLRGEASDRKLRLFACACCRRIWHLLTDPRACQAVDVTERFADGQAALAELIAAKREAHQAAGEGNGATPALTAAWFAARAGSPRYAVWDIAWFTAWYAARAVAGPPATWNTERQGQAALLREIVGNPFRSGEPTKSWPARIIHLAEAMYAGDDCHTSLAEQLLNMGETALAEHFQTTGHPRGCWGLDVILGKLVHVKARRRRGIRARRSSAGRR